MLPSPPSRQNPSAVEIAQPLGNPKMPEVYVQAVEGRTVEQKRALVKDITDAVCRHFGTTADRVMVEIVETKPHNKAKGGVLFSDR